MGQRRADGGEVKIDIDLVLKLTETWRRPFTDDQIGIGNGRIVKCIGLVGE